MKGILKEAEAEQEIIDHLLDKISDHGFDSLNDIEREYLDQASAKNEVDDEVDRQLRNQLNRGMDDEVEGFTETASEIAQKVYDDSRPSIIDQQLTRPSVERVMHTAMANRLSEMFQYNFQHVETGEDDNRDPHYAVVFAVNSGVYMMAVDPLSYSTEDGNFLKKANITSDDMMIRKLSNDPDDINNYTKVQY